MNEKTVRPNPTTKVSQPVPRHREINDHLARHLISMLSNPLSEDTEDDENSG